MTDLIKRLREEPYPYEKRHGLGITAMEVWHKTACEAADEIERLTANLEHYEEALCDLHYKDEEIERLTEQLDWHQHESVLRDMAIDAQKAEIERLNCALTISRGKHENAIREIERLKAVVDAMIDSIPTTWLDPVLSGKDAIPLPMGTYEVEELFRRIKARLQSIAALEDE